MIHLTRRQTKASRILEWALLLTICAAIGWVVFWLGQNVGWEWSVIAIAVALVVVAVKVWRQILLGPQVTSAFISMYDVIFEEHNVGKALAEIDRVKPPKQRAELQFQLGLILSESTLGGDRAANLEGSIFCYQLALEVYTRHTMPTEWATITTNLANSYSIRIRGERADNIEKAINWYLQALKIVTRHSPPIEWALTLHNLADAYVGRISGEQADNIEKAITYFQQALEIRTRQAVPVDWAVTKLGMANAYQKRIRGERADNIEQAIVCYQQALEVLTRRAMPMQWAAIMSNLGNSYTSRIRGERVENIEQAITCIQRALEVYTRQAMPSEWAQTLLGLANVFLLRIHGEPADNIEQAIIYYRQALEVLTRQAMPIQWALSHLGLANAFLVRIRGEQAETVEQAIASYQQALEVLTRQAMPIEWALIMENLASVFLTRIHGQQVDNIEQAIIYYRQVLEVLTRQAMPIQWARITGHLALAYQHRIDGERADNIEQAIASHQEALEVLTRQSIPIQWAQVMENLATAFLIRIHGERADNIEHAIVCYQQALEVETRQAMPIQWAAIMINLGNSYTNRIRGERAENLEQAIDCFQQALEVNTRGSMPREHLNIQKNLGVLHFDERHWNEAHKAYIAAIIAGDDLLSEAYTEVGRRADVAKTSRLYSYAAYSLLRMSKLNESLVQLEAGKTRLMSEVLALSDIDLKLLSDSQYKTLARARQVVHELEAEMRMPQDTPARRSDRELAEHLQQARTELNQLIAALRQEYPDFMPTEVTLPEILSLVSDGKALVAPVITSQGSAVFVIPHGIETVTAKHVTRLDTFTDDTLNDLLFGDESNPGWLRAYNDSHGQNWSPDIERIMQQVWEMLIAPVHMRLSELGVKRVSLIPSGGMQLLPLHAAWRAVNGTKRYWLDDYEITYAPSAYALRASQRRAANLKADGLTALVAGVSEYQHLSPLPFTRPEVEEVGQLFHAIPLLGQAATVSAVREKASGASYLHLSCHGSFAWGQDPLASALYLANDEPLTLAEVIGKLDLKSTRLVTLSACETGIIDVRQSPDEYIGLPAGFMQAGAAGVVSSLWSVNDLSTALLMIKFYGYHLKDKQSPAQALRRAQLWLRDATNAELSELFVAYKASAPDAPATSRMAFQMAQEHFRTHTLSDPDARPFAGAYYWAGFVCYGV